MSKRLAQILTCFLSNMEDNILLVVWILELAKSQVDEGPELSQLANDVTRFEHGDQTLVGEKDHVIGWPEATCLSIARALIEPVDLIIMDNVLSAVDYETERKILEVHQSIEKSILHGGFCIVLMPLNIWTTSLFWMKESDRERWPWHLIKNLCLLLRHGNYNRMKRRQQHVKRCWC